MTEHHRPKRKLLSAQHIEPIPTVQTWEAQEVGEGETKINEDVIERYRALAPAELNRRHFTKLMLASLGVAGLSNSLAGCVKRPLEEIVPYVNAPENVVPGIPTYYTSVFTRNGYGYGVVVESHEGRPTKVEGNPAHPASLGASDSFMQAELLNVYDPDRSRTITKDGQISNLGELELALLEKKQYWDSTNGAGLHIVTPPINSPSMAAQLQQVLRRYPESNWHQWQVVNDDNAMLGARLAFGQDVNVIYQFKNADVVLQLDGDLLSELPGSLAYASDFASRRDPLKEMSRIYAVESKPSLMGAMADHRLALRADKVEILIAALVEHFDEQKDIEDFEYLTEHSRRWLQRCAQDLSTHRNRGLVVAGRDQSPAVHAMVHWLNNYLGNVGHTLVYQQPLMQRPELMGDSLKALVDAMAADKVDSLFLLDCNPALDTPTDWAFARLLKTVPFRVHLGSYLDETGSMCTWHLPLSHVLESWGDAKAYDGTLAIQQPLIQPLYDSVSPYSLLALLAGDGWQTDYQRVRAYWITALGEQNFERRWRKLLIEGLQNNSASQAITPQLSADVLQTFTKNTPRKEDALLLQFAPDPKVGDGRYANNAWLQELPDPFTKLTWGNAALLSPLLAAKHNIQQGDIVNLQAGEDELELPVVLCLDHPDDAITVHFGYGRKINVSSEEAAICDGVGVNVYPLRRSTSMVWGRSVHIKKTGRRTNLAITQHHSDMEEREPIRDATVSHFKRDPSFIATDQEAHPPQESLYPEPVPEPFDHASDYDWAMSIDLNACIGCSACTVACQAENNIPVVGRDQVLAGREMHWIRIDRYYEYEPQKEPQYGPKKELKTLFQPLPCQHCENAPCEYVCPVGATVHDSEGLNVMVYNRCIGTRDCSQNCPYKVRRFNFLDYNYDQPRTRALAPVHNPDVTVRSRGVMEKCTYCVQRISGARRQAKKENRTIADGEVVTACQQTCPTQAISFGNINDPDSKIREQREHPLNYSLLAELNTRPRTTYVARIRNSLDDEELGKQQKPRTEEQG